MIFKQVFVMIQAQWARVQFKVGAENVCKNAQTNSFLPDHTFGKILRIHSIIMNWKRINAIREIKSGRSRIDYLEFNTFEDSLTTNSVSSTTLSTGSNFVDSMLRINISAAFLPISI